jgi:ATP/maltotriose-dependent transcriptional regulator MalT
MELALPAIRRNRQDATLLGWLDVLPDDVVRANPVLSVFCGWMPMVSGDLDGVGPRLDDAERALATMTTPDADAEPVEQAQHGVEDLVLGEGPSLADLDDVARLVCDLFRILP